MQCLQQLLQRSVILNILPEDGHKTAAATVVFKRMKPRLPSDELQAVLASVQGTKISFASPLIELCMHPYMLHSVMHRCCMLQCQYTLPGQDSNVGQSYGLDAVALYQI